MKILTQCPFCSEAFELEQDALDRRVRCPKCKMLFKIPHEKQLNSAIKKMEEAKATVYIDPKGNTYA